MGDFIEEGRSFSVVDFIKVQFFLYEGRARVQRFLGLWLAGVLLWLWMGMMVMMAGSGGRGVFLFRLLLSFLLLRVKRRVA